MPGSVHRPSQHGPRPRRRAPIEPKLTSLAAGAALIAFLHAVFPTHWLPFALVARAQRWSAGRLAAVTAAAAAGHVLITGAVGLVVAVAGQEMAGALAGGERLGGAILVAFGMAYALFDLRHLGHRRVHHVHDGEVHDAAHHATALGDRAAIGSLVLLLSVSPCIALTPIFYEAGSGAGLRGAAAIAVLNALVTVPVMTGMASLAARGLAWARLERFERRERLIVGLVLAALGAAVLVLHHEHPA